VRSGGGADYEPEIIATPIAAGSTGYLAWIDENVDA
jgi:uncharacterized protein involved in tolerance to divalent cations